MLPIGIDWCQIFMNFAKDSKCGQMLVYGARWFQKKNFSENIWPKIWFLQKTFKKNIYKKRSKNQIIKNVF